ncbi:MAG: tRNA (adenosine(37)-N6)-threonylcarbamoyltransferase complex dimerization subunit type 1 TsaB [Bacteroidia bacterium]|nr:tRNA (adenosine(37)-N6)-threonylcarbamoyltransferase complex dimerization subunit type 1 TsaB [Bacteroidia bacterium]
MKKLEGQGPYILMIESATAVGSVALYNGDKLMGHTDIHVGRTHARLLLPMISTLLEQLQVDKSVIDAIAVSKGPGSYTGLRVGVSSAKGLCLALGKPLLALDSLEILARQVEVMARQLDAFICPMIDARRMEVYTASYDSGIKRMGDIHAHILEEDSFQNLLAERKVIFVGDGASKAEPLFVGNEQAIFLPHVLSTAVNLGPTLLKKFEEGDFEDQVLFEPFYLKDFVATKPKDRLRS